MTDDELIAHLHQTGRNLMLGTVRQAADRIKVLAEERDALRAEVERLTAQANDEHEWRMDSEAKLFVEESARIAAEAERDRLRNLLLSVADHIRPKQDRSGNGVVVAALHRAADEIAALTTKGEADENT